MFIFSNGCSHTAWNFNEGYVSLVARCLLKNGEQFDNSKLEFATQYLFGGEMEDGSYHLKDPFYSNTFLKNNDDLNLSFAYPGKSNDTIFFETYESLIYLKNINKLPDYVFIQWSGPNRRLHSDPSGIWIDVGPHRVPELQVKFEPMASMQTMHYMLLLQNFLNFLNIEYVFLCYMELDNHIEKIKSFKELNLNRFISLDGFHPIFDGFRNQFRDLEWALDWHGHPDARAHYKLSELILNKINKSEKIVSFDKLYTNNSDLLLKGSYDFSLIKKKGIMHLLKDGQHEVLDEHQIPWTPSG